MANLIPSRSGLRLKLIIFLLIPFSLTALPRYQTEGSVRLSANTPAPGDPLALVLEPRANRMITTVKLLDADGKLLTSAPAFELDTPLVTTQAVIIGIPTTALPGNAYLRLSMTDGSEELRAIHIQPRDFIVEIIALDQSNTAIRTVQPVVRNTEAEELWQILLAPPTALLTTEAFQLPVAEKRRTAFFGDRRTYYYIDGATSSTIHAGIDFAVPTGTVVRASAQGRVVLAKARQVSGLTVILDHGGGVFSLYFHLSSIEVTTGELVRAGDRLGLSGATGLATGPHLHWEIRAGGEAVDPDSFVGPEAITRFIGQFGVRAAQPLF